MSQKKKQGGQPKKCKKAKKMGKSVTRDFNRITVRLNNLDEVKTHAMKKLETFNKYLNRIIAEDIIATGDEDTVIKYFDKEETF